MASLSLFACAGCGERRTETVADPSAPRVVSLAPNLTEMLFDMGAGDLLVGRSSACTFPPDGVKSIPVVADFGKPNLEVMASLKPTVVLASDLEDAAVGRQIERLGARLVSVPCETLDDIPAAMECVGEAVGRPAEAARRAGAFRSELTNRRLALKDRKMEAAPGVLIEIWGDPPLIAGRRSFLSDMVALAGGRNLGDELDGDYMRVSLEWIARQSPHAIFMMHKDISVNPAAWFLRRAGWKDLQAVKSGRVYRPPDPDCVLRPGPRTLDGVAWMASVLQGL